MATWLPAASIAYYGWRNLPEVTVKSKIPNIPIDAANRTIVKDALFWDKSQGLDI